MENANELKGSKDSKVKSFFKRNKLNLIIFFVILIIILCVNIYKKMYGNIETYTIVNGYVEKSSDTVGYVIKDESVASISGDGVAIPVIEQGKKAAKGEIVAIYKDESYAKYLEEIDQMDKDIQTLIKDLPAAYSSDVKDIDSQIAEISKEALKTTSYIKMQEYKNKLDELSYKKVLVLGSLSPEGSKIRELIEEREAYEKESKTSSNNIKAPMAGVVTYKIDGLEDVTDTNKVFRLSASGINELISKYAEDDKNKFGVKIVDNYNAYIIVKEKKGENDDYIIKAKNYNIRLSDYSDTKITGELVKVIEDDDCYYCIFNLQNGIENIIDDRNTNINIVWKKVAGMAIPSAYISKDEEKGYSYVTMIHAGEYLDIPVNIVIESDNVCIVENMSKDDLEKYNLESSSGLEIYDQIIIKKN